MSWIFGFVGERVREDRRRELSAIHPPALHRVDRPGLYLAAGGIPETCLRAPGADAGRERGWLVAGLGIVRRHASCAFLSAAGWDRRLAHGRSELADVDGHYVLVRWSGTRLICHTDPLGLRTLYLRDADGGVYVSTRLDWLAEAAGPLDVDFAALGSHWLGANQYAYRSLVCGVRRLGPAGTAIVAEGGVEVVHRPWMPGGAAEEMDLEDAVAPFLAPRLSGGLRLSLGLSGGLDSRVLLAVLEGGDVPFAAHVFGAATHPDAQVAAQIAGDEGLGCRRFRERPPGRDDALAQLAEHAASTHAATPASASAKLGAYDEMRAEGLVAVDGFFGEVARRQYYKHVVARHGRTLTQGPGDALFPLLRVHRADLFGEDAARLMRAGMVEDLDRMSALYASSGLHRPEDFADLLAVRFRLPNFAGYEQARLDEHALTFMPFAQRPFIATALGLPLRQRRSGRALRRIIRRHARPLTRYPLVKGAATYPYLLPAAPAWVWTNVKARLGAAYEDPWANEFLLSVEEFVQDTVHSADVRAFDAYDYDAVLSSVERFYGGDAEAAPFVDWWLSFEMWRRSIS